MESEAFPEVDTSSWDIIRAEPSGAEPKIWLEQPGSSLTWMFKPVTIKNGFIQGEDWAEKVVSELAPLLLIPCAQVNLAIWETDQGSVSRNLRPDSHSLQSGRAWMQICEAPGFDPGIGSSRKGVPGRPGHNLTNIRAVLVDALPPPGCQLPFEVTAFDVFAGFTLLDAWVANRDRHDENWAVLVPDLGTGPVLLCGSYDHSNSLGFNVQENDRARHLSTDIALRRWCERGTAHRFEHAPGQAPQTLVQLARHALELVSPDARAFWLDRLEAIDPAEVRKLLDRTPRMSEAARTFAETVLATNRRRILDACR